MVVSTAGNDAETPIVKILGQMTGITDCLLLDIFEIVAHGFPERYRLGGNHMHQRATLNAGEDSFVYPVGIFLFAKNHASPWSPKGFMGGGGNKIGERYR